MDYKKTGEFLKSLRKANGLTQEEVSNHLLVSPKTISRWECGDGLPDINIISNVASLYNVTVDEILKGERRIKEENLKEETINLKNRNKDKILMNSILKKFNVYFYIALGANLALLIVGLILLCFNVYVSIFSIIIGIIVPTFILFIGKKDLKEKINDNLDLIGVEVKNNINNKCLSRFLLLFDVYLVSFVIKMFIYYFSALNFKNTDYDTALFLDLFFLNLIVIISYLIIRLPLIGKNNYEINKKSSITILIISNIIIILFGTISSMEISMINPYSELWSKYTASLIVFLSGIKEYLKPHPMFYFELGILVINMVLFIIFNLKEKYNLLWISLILSIMNSLMFIFVSCKIEDARFHRHMYYPSLTGIMAAVFFISIIVILSKKEKNNQ